MVCIYPTPLQHAGSLTQGQFFKEECRWFAFGVFLLLDWLPYQSEGTQFVLVFTHSWGESMNSLKNFAFISFNIHLFYIKKFFVTEPINLNGNNFLFLFWLSWITFFKCDSSLNLASSSSWRCFWNSFRTLLWCSTISFEVSSKMLSMTPGGVLVV